MIYHFDGFTLDTRRHELRRTGERVHVFLPDGTPEQMQWFDDPTRTMPVRNALRIEEVAHDIDVRAETARVTVPTLVLHARGEAMVPLEAGRLLAALSPGARFVPLASRNHVLLDGEPARVRFVEEVRGFLG